MGNTQAGPKSIIEVANDPAARVAAIVSEAAAKAISAHGAFSIAIAGGSLVKMLGAMADMPGVQWDKWHVAWVDERCVPHDHPDSNYGGAREAWLSKVPIPSSQVHAIDQSLCTAEAKAKGGAAMAAAAADDYQRRLQALPREVLPRSADGSLPAFDLLLLGFGPDGHICSLFPGHPLLEDTSGNWVLPISDSPKPPPERITLSMAAVHTAVQIVLVGTGDGKKEILKSALTPGSKLPCALTLPKRPTWILDPPAAALIMDAFAAESDLRTQLAGCDRAKLERILIDLARSDPTARDRISRSCGTEEGASLGAFVEYELKKV